LHQATERYITALLLVKTSYKPKTHDLEILYNKIIEIDSSFQDVFDLSNEKEHHHFELLRKAYIEARYSKTYAITQEELAFIEQKIKDMSQKVQQFCKAEIEK
jgi:HEPN domain-containing protein